MANEERKQFVGVHTTPRVKRQLERIAAKYQVSVSMLCHKYLSDAVGAPAVALQPGQGTARRGRHPAPRVRLTKSFLEALALAGRGLPELALQTGFPLRALSAIYREGTVVLTGLTHIRLRQLAHVVNYAGQLTTPV